MIPDVRPDVEDKKQESASEMTIPEFHKKLLSVLLVALTGCASQKAMIFLHRPENNGNMNIVQADISVFPSEHDSRKTVIASLLGGDFKGVAVLPGQYVIRVQSDTAWQNGKTNLWVSDWETLDIGSKDKRYFIILPKAEDSAYIGVWELIEVPSPEEWKQGLRKNRQANQGMHPVDYK